MAEHRNIYSFADRARLFTEEAPAVNDDKHGLPHNQDMTTITRDELDAKLSATEARVDLRAANMDARFSQVESQLSQMLTKMDARFEAMDARFASMDARMDARFESMETKMAARFAVIEGKVSHMDATMSDLKLDVREGRKESRSVGLGLILAIIASAVTIYFGIDASNKAMVQGMQSSFTLGRDAGSVQGQTAAKLEQLQDQVKDIKEKAQQQK